MGLPEEAIRNLELFATETSMDVVDIIYKAKSGHPGGSLSCMDILTALYHPDYGVMKYDPKNPDWEGRDRFVLSAGHKAPALYAVLSKVGYFPREELYTLRQINSRLQGHTSLKTPGVETASGSLGQGLSQAVGKADAAKIKGKDWRVYCLIGDGETDEGQIWEAARDAYNDRLNNLCVILDHNGLQLDGEFRGYPIREKWLSFNWSVIGEEIPRSKRTPETVLSGHNYRFLFGAFDEAKKESGRPTIIIANTIKARGIPLMEDKVDSHGTPPNQEQYEDAMRKLKELKERLENEIRNGEKI